MPSTVLAGLPQVWGLNSLFTDLPNFNDPLNVEASEHHLRDKKEFWNKVNGYNKWYPDDGSGACSMDRARE